MAAHSGVHVSDHIRSTLFNILQNSGTGDGQNDTLLTSVIKVSHGFKLFGDEKANVQNWVGHVNQCLGAAKTRLEGLGLLAIVVDQCPAPVFQHNCASWMRLLVQILQSHDSVEVIHLASSSLANILRGASDIPELSRDISTNHIPGLISTLIALKPQLQLCSLHVLSSCLSHFAGPCGPYKNKLENYLLSAIQSSSQNIVLAACKCYILLPRVGGGGTGGAKHTEAWDQFCDKIVNTGHTIMEQLYQDVETETYAATSSETLKLAAAPETEPKRTTCLLQHFETICTCLHNLLEEDFPAQVNIPMEGILTLCCRTMAVTGKMMTHRLTTEMTLLAASLPALHVAAFTVLSALIASCRGHLIPHGQVINKLFIQSLAWTHSDGTGKQKPYSTLRLSACQCLHMWLEVVGSCSGLECVAETLVDQLLQDTRPPVDVTKLSTSSEESFAMGSGKKGKKSKQKGQRSTGHELTVHSRVNEYANSDVCAAALKVLRLMFLRLGMKLKPAIHKEVQEFAVPLLLQVQQSPNTPPIPYSSGVCREELYRLLLACVLVPHGKWPAPLQCAVRIFSMGRQDLCIQVASTCAEASVICTNLLHPKVPSLHEPIKLAEITTKSKETIHQVMMNIVPSEAVQPQVVVQRETVEKENDGSNKVGNGDVEDMNATSSAQRGTSQSDQAAQKSATNDDESDDDNDDDSGDDMEDSNDSQQKSTQDNQVRDEKRTASDPSSDSLPVATDSVGDSGDATVGGIKPEEGEGTSIGDQKEPKTTGNQDAKGSVGKRKREEEQEEPETSVGKKKATAEEETSEELSSMMSTFVDSFPDSD